MFRVMLHRYVAYDLGTQLAAGSWPGAGSVGEMCSAITDPEFLKVCFPSSWALLLLCSCMLVVACPLHVWRLVLGFVSPACSLVVDGFIGGGPRSLR